MNRIAYRYDDSERCEAAPLSIFEAKLELKPDELSCVNPVAWSTSPDFINAKLLKQGELVTESINESYNFWASWSSVSVYIIYNSFSPNEP